MILSVLWQEPDVGTGLVYNADNLKYQGPDIEKFNILIFYAQNSIAVIFSDLNASHQKQLFIPLTPHILANPRAS